MGTTPYVTNEMYGTNAGLMILDLQYLPDSVRFVGSYEISPDIRSPIFLSMWRQEFAYIEEPNGWLILDLADP
jgi:hypothetical protein